MIRYSLILFTLLMISCGGSKSVITKDFGLDIKKGPCFGSCPVYTLNIDHEGLATYDGIRFTDLVGKHTLLLSPETVQDLNKAFEKADFENFKDNYESEIADLASVSISYRNTNIDKTVVGKMERPEKVKELEELLESLLNLEGWQKVASEEKVEEIVEEEKEEVIDNEFIIKFKEGTAIAKWIRTYREYGLNVRRPISDDRWVWLMDFKKGTKSSKEMYNMLKADEVVESIEFNKPVEKR